MTFQESKDKNTFDDKYGELEEMFGRPYRELQDYFKKVEPKGVVLDVGCGQGRDALYLASLGYDVTALDTSKVGVEQMLEKAKQKNLSVKGIVGDARSTEINGMYDIILFDMVLHGFEESERLRMIEEYSKKLNKDGIICIVFPDDMKEEDFIKLSESENSSWSLRDKVVIHDVPTVDGEDVDYTFIMIVVQKTL